MYRALSPLVVATLLSLNAPAWADAPPKTPAYQAADSFASAWKYDQGIDAPISIPEAVRLYTIAANAGNSLAKGRLAILYDSGTGVPKNKAEADRLMKGIFPEILKAATNNNAIAQTMLDYMYSDGLGVARDEQEGLKWSLKAAGQNLPLGMFNVAVSYENGIGVERNAVEAVSGIGKQQTSNCPSLKPTLATCI
jgi:TPR repeat protein